jgi:hypothetical protein
MNADIKRVHAEVASLTDELAGLEALAERHAAAAGAAARSHRKGDADAAELQAAVSARAAIDYARDEIRRELEAARAQVAEMESAAADEALLAEIAAGTVAYHQAEAEHFAVLDGAQQAIALAIVRSQELAQESSAAMGRAKQAALALAARHNNAPAHGHAPLAEYQRAVIGADVKPLNGSDQVRTWPSGHIFPLLREVPNSLMGVSIRPAEGA